MLQQAQQIAYNAASANIETEHILKALLNDKDSPVEYLLKRNAVNVSYVDDKLDAAMAKIAKSFRQRACPIIKP
ncbi:MAG: Clp protease N-terminal domain-containing protein [Ferruginibacter sp.]